MSTEPARHVRQSWPDYFRLEREGSAASAPGSNSLPFRCRFRVGREAEPGASTPGASASAQRERMQMHLVPFVGALGFIHIRSKNPKPQAPTKWKGGRAWYGCTWLNQMAESSGSASLPFGLRFRFLSFGLQVGVSGFGLEFQVLGLKFGVWGLSLEFSVQGFGFRGRGSFFRLREGRVRV